MISNEMMEVLKVYPVWPEGYNYINVTTKTACMINEAANCFYVDHLEHIAARAELFKGGSGDEEFYIEVKTDGYSYKGLSRQDGDLSFAFSGIRGRCISPDLIIPRPTPEEMKMLEDSKINEKWMPEIGVECRYYYLEGKEWRKGTPYCDYKGGWIIIDSEDECPSICFRRHTEELKTEREKLYEKCVEAIKSTTISEHPSFAWRDSVEILIDKGLINDGQSND